MFGITIPPGVDIVRIHALSGRQGKPPCFWEGAPAVAQASIEAAMGSDVRVIHWLKRNQLIQNGAATLTLQIDCFSQGKRVESFNAPDVTILVGAGKRKKGPGDEIALRAFDMAEFVIGTYKEMVDERDTLVGRLVERGLKVGEPQKPVELPPAAQEKDSLDDLLEKGAKFLSLAQSFRSLRGSN